MIDIIGIYTLKIVVMMLFFLVDGYKFFVSSNNVLLSPGKFGVIPPKYFKGVKTICPGM